MNNTVPWTESEIQRMLDLDRDGKSCGQIGIELGRTRNAVIGKLHREKVKRGLKTYFPSDITNRSINILPEKAISPELERNTIPKRKYTRVVPPPSLSAKGVGVILPMPKIVIEKGKMVGILDVKGCRWPTEAVPGLIGTHAFCNAETDTGRSYCAEHLAMNKAPYSRDLIRSTVRQVVYTLKRAGRAA